MQSTFAAMEDELHSMAVNAARLSDFGGWDYLPGLRALLAAFDSDPKLTEFGRQFALGNIVGTLTARAAHRERLARAPRLSSDSDPATARHYRDSPHRHDRSA